MPAVRAMTHMPLGRSSLSIGFAQFVALFAFDPARHAAAARVVRHQHQVAAGERNERGQRGALVAALFLFDLDDDFLAFAQAVLDATRVAVATSPLRRCRREGRTARDFLERQEAVALVAVIDEAGFERRLDAGDDALVDVALALFLAADSMSRSISFWPSTIATRSSSAWVALNSMRFMDCGPRRNAAGQAAGTKAARRNQATRLTLTRRLRAKTGRLPARAGRREVSETAYAWIRSAGTKAGFSSCGLLLRRLAEYPIGCGRATWQQQPGQNGSLWRRAAAASNRPLPGAGAALFLYHRYLFA